MKSYHFLKKDGYTLIEVLIVGSLVALIAVAISSSFSLTLNTTKFDSSSSQINMNGQTTLNHIVNELRYANYSSINISLTKDSITFQTPKSSGTTYSIAKVGKNIEIKTDSTKSYSINMVESFVIEKDSSIPKKINVSLSLKDNKNVKSPTIILHTSVYPLN